MRFKAHFLHNFRKFGPQNTQERQKNLIGVNSVYCFMLEECKQQI